MDGRPDQIQVPLPLDTTLFPPSKGRGPYHRLQEAVDRIEVHCLVLTDQRVPAEDTDALRLLAGRFTRHFVALERLRSRTAQLIELWERP